MNNVGFLTPVLFLAITLSACSSGGSGGNGSTAAASPSASTAHLVSVSWAPNHESGVNSLGGGYQVLVNGQPTAIVPYASGSLAPTSTTISLTTGTYTVAVRAYAALDPQGFGNGTYSVASQPITINVP